MPSFDIVSEVNLQEVDNAVNQAKKELESRYDLRGTSSAMEWDKKTLITLTSNDEKRVDVVRDILQTKLHKRGVEMSSVKWEKAEPAGGMLWKQKGTLQQGIDKDAAKAIVKSIKDSKLKVQSQIMDEQVRVTSKSIDELQATISHCKAGKFGIPLQFTNMRS
ncbi:MAG: YajQ family cyclic di-GMP-binding protein [Bdellovibrionaceae bacterium]|nr:YajQ family cyclic di-GMP-binding protein [Pseudobdellovibrionaceae bacterium]